MRLNHTGHNSNGPHELEEVREDETKEKQTPAHFNRVNVLHLQRGAHQIPVVNIFTLAAVA